MCCVYCSCSSIKWASVPVNSQAPIENKRIILYWNEHQLPVENAQIVDSVFHANLKSFYPFEPQAHIYLDSTFVLDKSFNGKVSIPLDLVNKIEFPNSVADNSGKGEKIIAILLVGLTLFAVISILKKDIITGDFNFESN